MEIQQKEKASEILELINRVNYFQTLKPIKDSFAATLKIDSYAELQIIISALLKSSITLLQTETSGKAFPDAMILVEMALQLLPNDEMELLDEVRRVGIGG